jgi:TonB family protein
MLRRFLFAVPILTACISQDSAQKAILAVQTANTPDVLPRMLNPQLPFAYPSSLYKSRIQGNVTLHLRIDSTGLVLPESTSVKTSSGYPQLDSAALDGSKQLRFAPALKDKKAMAVSIDLPVFYRHPGSPPLPGDSVLTSKSAPPGKTP